GLDSALEGLCVRPEHVPQRSLYRELVATALNCAMSGSGDCDAVIGKFVEVSFGECNALCAGELDVSPESLLALAERCTDHLECYNRGGRHDGNKCALGQCDVTGDLCGGDYGACPPVASVPVTILQTCRRFSGNCRNEEFCQPALELCPPRLPFTSSR